jgi:hypothetical protein
LSYVCVVLAPVVVTVSHWVAFVALALVTVAAFEPVAGWESVVTAVGYACV